MKESTDSCQALACSHKLDARLFQAHGQFHRDRQRPCCKGDTSAYLHAQAAACHTQAAAGLAKATLERRAAGLGVCLGPSALGVVVLPAFFAFLGLFFFSTFAALGFCGGPWPHNATGVGSTCAYGQNKCYKQGQAWQIINTTSVQNFRARTHPLQHANCPTAACQQHQGQSRCCCCCP